MKFLMFLNFAIAMGLLFLLWITGNPILVINGIWIWIGTFAVILIWRIMR